MKRVRTNFFLSFGLISLVFLSACSKEEKKLEPIPRHVSVMVIEDTKNYQSRTISGVVQPYDSTDLSFEVTGKVDYVYVELGEAFIKDQPLAQLDQTTFSLTVKERQGQLSEAKALLFEAKRDFERNSELVKIGAVSTSQFDMSKSQYEAAIDQVEIATARLGMAKKDLKDTVLKAPYNGSVSARFIEPSQQVNPNVSAFTVQGDSGFEVALLVPEDLIDDVSIDQLTKVSVPALDILLDAKVKEIGSAAEDASSFPVTLSIQSSDSLDLKSGMSAEATFKIAHTEKAKENIILPVTALLAAENNQHFVFRLIQSNQETQAEGSYLLQKVPIQVINYFDQNAAIQGDLHNGERIVDAGVAFLREGMTVAPIDGQVRIYNP